MSLPLQHHVGLVLNLGSRMQNKARSLTSAVSVGASTPEPSADPRGCC